MIADKYDAFFLDLDGVVYVGSSPTDGAVAALEQLRSMGKDIRFLTNNPTDQEEIVARLGSLGIEAARSEVVTCGTATASVLAEQDAGSVWTLGHDGLRRALSQGGLKLVEGRPCDAVVVGWDDSITLSQIREARPCDQKRSHIRGYQRGQDLSLAPRGSSPVSVWWLTL